MNRIITGWLLLVHETGLTTDHTVVPPMNRWVFEDLPELREAMREELSVFTISGDMKDYLSMKSLCDKYNSALIRVLESRGPHNTPLPGNTIVSMYSFTIY